MKQVSHFTGLAVADLKIKTLLCEQPGRNTETKIALHLDHPVCYTKGVHSAKIKRSPFHSSSTILLLQRPFFLLIDSVRYIYMFATVNELTECALLNSIVQCANFNNTFIVQVVLYSVSYLLSQHCKRIKINKNIQVVEISLPTV